MRIRAEHTDCPLCGVSFVPGDLLRPRLNAPGPCHAECLTGIIDYDRETGAPIFDTLPTYTYTAPGIGPVCYEAEGFTVHKIDPESFSSTVSDWLQDAPPVDLEIDGGDVEITIHTSDAWTTPSLVDRDVVDLVVAAREFWDDKNDLSPESHALDKALEPFSSRVPYENEPEADHG